MSRPDLIDDNAVTNVNNKVNKKFTETTMMVDLLANTQKLVESDKRIYYKKGNGNEEHDDKNDDCDKLDDDVLKYRGKTNIFEKSKDDRKGLTESEKKPPQKHTEHKEHKEQKQDSVTDGTAVSKVDHDDETKWSKEEMLLKKLAILQKLGELSQNGVELSQNYNLNSYYKTIKF